MMKKNQGEEEEELQRDEQRGGEEAKRGDGQGRAGMKQRRVQSGGRARSFETAAWRGHGSAVLRSPRVPPPPQIS